MVFRKLENGFILKLEKGEEIIATLSDFAQKEKIDGGFVYGIGTANNLTLGYYNADKKDYLKKAFQGDFEIVSLMGNISLLKGSPVAHIHMVISDSNFNCSAGHLFSGTIAATGEFVIHTTKSRMERVFDPQTSLNLLKL